MMPDDGFRTRRTMPSRWSTPLNRRAAVALGLTAATACLATRPANAQSHDHGASTPDASTAASPAVTGPISVRRNARDLSTDEKRAFVNAILKLKTKASPWIPDINSYDTFVLWHRDAFNCDIMAAHMAPAFLPWHRVFLHYFERELHSVDPSVTLPYWDWTVDNGKDSYVWQDDLMGGNGDPSQGYAVTTGPFVHPPWTLTVFDYTDNIRAPYLIRDFGAGNLGPTLPTAEQVEEALAISTYDSAPWSSLTDPEQSFRNFLEGWRGCTSESCDPLAGMGTGCGGDHLLHNRVHLWVAGEFTFAHETPPAIPGTPRVATPSSNGDTSAASETILSTMAANSSPNDPVFWLHHANIDRIWNLWLARHGEVYAPVNGGPVGHNLHDAMWPYHGIGAQWTPAMVLNSEAIGYRYDTDE